MGATSRSTPTCEALEPRQLLTVTAANNHAAVVNHVRQQFHAFQAEVRDLQAPSRVTMAEFAALRDDARAIGAAASPDPGLTPAAVAAKALVASIQLDRAPLEGWLGDPGWANVRDRLAGNLDGLNVPGTLVDQAVADMEAVAGSAGTSSAAFQDFTRKSEALQDAENRLGPGDPSFPDPGSYFTIHLRGYVHGWQAMTRQAQSRLASDLRSIHAEAHAAPADAAALTRDVGLLAGIGGRVTGAAFARLGSAYVATFAGGAAGLGDASRIAADLKAALGTGGAADDAAIAQLAADAPATYRAAGASVAHISTLVADVQALAVAGGASTPDPFRVRFGTG